MDITSNIYLKNVVKNFYNEKKWQRFNFKFLNIKLRDKSPLTNASWVAYMCGYTMFRFLVSTNRQIYTTFFYFYHLRECYVSVFI